MKKLLSLILAFATFYSCLTLTACKNTTSSKNAFTYWMGTGESSTYYTNYEENPVMQYIMKHKKFETESGEEKNIDFKYTVPIPGQEIDSLNALLSTKTYTDVVDTTFGFEGLSDMYKQGVVLDLTEYVEKHMPNYKAFMENHPELAPYFTTTVDGEEKYLEIRGFYDTLDIYEQFCGYCYRRDWIIKYGKQPDQLWSLDDNNNKVFRNNPNAGKAFNGYYSLDKSGKEIHSIELTDDVNNDSWVDDVLFPSGNTDPVYISDWEWMLGVFKKALADQNISDGYTMSLWYPGFIDNGELANAFGGGNPVFYINKETGKATFGGVEEGFKTYMETMNKWYKNGWIDQRFNEKSSEVFYQVDENLVFQGKVGLWMGVTSHLGTRIYNERQPLTKGIVIYGAANPINDLYGSNNVKFKEPYTMFQNEMAGGGVVITDKAKDKDIVQLVKFFDYLFSDEGSLLRTMGLSKEQYDESQSPLYKKYNLTEGAYTVNDAGKYEYVSLLMDDNAGIRGAMTMGRVVGLSLRSNLTYDYTPTYIHWREQWVRYKSTGFFNSMYLKRIDPVDSKELSKLGGAIVKEYMYIEIPKFIVGQYNFTTDYENFLTSLKKRNYEKVVGFYQKTVDVVSKFKRQ